MDIGELKLGMRVNHHGLCYVVRKIDTGEPGKVLVQPLQGRYGRENVDASRLSPWVPKPKTSPHAKTCQICSRQIFAETGVIAHHGYERPGDGHQTASCFGARQLTWEVSRDALGDWLRVMRDRAIGCRTYLGRLQTGEETVYIMHKRSRFDPAVLSGKKPESELIEVTPSAANYADVLAKKIAATRREFDGYRDEYRHQRKRYAGWKPAPSAERKD